MQGGKRMISPTEFIMSIGSESILFAHKADLLIKKEQIEEALELCEEGVKRFPFYTEGYVQLARAHQLLEQDEQAVEAYKKALFFQPGHAKALKGLAYLYYKMREKELGERTLVTAYLYDPFDQELHDFLKSENLLAGIYTPLVFEEEQEEASNEAENVTLDLEEILDDSRPTDDDERQQIIEKIDENPTSEDEEDIDHFLFPEIEEGTTLKEGEAELDLGEGLAEDDFESDFFPNDLSDITPGVGEPSEDEGAIIEEAPPQGEKSTEEPETAAEQSTPQAQEQNEREEFSAWMMQDLFQAEDTSVNEETPQPEPEEPEHRETSSAADESLFSEEEHPVLDTALIFADHRQEEPPSEEKEAEEKTSAEAVSEGEKPVADFNTLEEDIERISSQDAAAIENIMTEPASETSEELDEVIKRIQESTEKKKDDSSLKQLDFDRKQAQAVEDEEVNIEDILNNPSLLTPTFGEILIAQHKFEDALKVFQALAKKEPDNPRFQKKIDFLTKLVSAKK